MKQLLQSLSNGKTLLQEVPKPKNKNGNILIETRKTLISSGTDVCWLSSESLMHL